MAKAIIEREEDLVEEFMLEKNVHVKIYDTYCKNKTKEEIQQIIERCSYIASEALSREGALV